MDFCNFDNVFDYPSYTNEREIEAPFLLPSSFPHQQTNTHAQPIPFNILPSPISCPGADDFFSIRSDPQAWSKYCAHIDNFLYYGVDSPVLPPDGTLSQLAYLSTGVHLSASLPMIVRSPVPLPRSESYSPFSPLVTQHEHGDQDSEMEDGSETPPIIPEHMLVEFQIDTDPETPDPPTPPQASTRSTTTRDPRCKCPGPILDWTRHWRRSCTGNPDRQFACVNGCGKTFTRKDNMKRHVNLGECKLDRDCS